VPAPATITAVLDWSDGSADLDLALKNPSGKTVATSSTVANPERLRYVTKKTSGTWNVVVISRSGAVDYSATVNVRPHGVQLWAPEHIRRAVYSREDALADARRFDLITSFWWRYEPYVEAMHRANPNLTMYHYANSHAVQAGQGPPAHPEDWYAKDADGNYVREPSGNWVMDISNAGWVGAVSNECGEAIDRGFDGCFLDVLGLGPFWLWSAVPISPATGQPYTMAEWNQASLSLAAAVRDALSPHPVMGNSLGAGWRYWDSALPSSAYLDVLDRMATEGFVRYPNDPIGAHRRERDWRKDVDMLADAASQGKQVLVVTSTATGGTRAQKDAWHRYTLASFLLGTNEEQWFSFRYGASQDPTTVHAWWKLELGSPQAQYEKKDGVYQRRFSKGKVLVNPTRSTYRVSLGGRYVDLAGNVRSMITLRAFSGAILRKA
jgi:hypothetical protein